MISLQMKNVYRNLVGVKYFRKGDDYECIVILVQLNFFFLLHLVKNSVETMPLIILPLIKYFESTTLTVWL